MVILSLDNINKSFNTNNNIYEVLKNISINIAENEVISIVGVSGSGKTTLLNIIADLETIDAGSINKISQLKINYVTQHAHFIEELSIFENLVFASLKDKNSEKKIKLYCDYFNCSHLLDKKPSVLSGGEKQRINIIRALFNDPKLIILDEPTAALDHENKFKVMKTLLELQKSEKIALVVVTHDLDLVNNLPNHSHYELNMKTLIKKH